MRTPVHSSITFRRLGPDDAGLIATVSSELFDQRPVEDLVGEFLADPRHHLIAALDGVTMVGFVSGVHYIHPDKPAEMFINEIGVVQSHRRRGIGKRLLGEVLRLAGELGCTNGWVLAEGWDVDAIRFYESLDGRAQNVVMFELPVD